MDQQQSTLKLYRHAIIYYMDKQELFGYQIERKLGEGAFGEVLLGNKEGKKVAIKKISKQQVIKVVQGIWR